MSGLLSMRALFVVLPPVVLVVSGLVATVRTPGPKVRSAILHFAAGVVFSVVAVELIPDLLRDHRPVETALGFTLGIVTMLGLRSILEPKEEGEPSSDVAPDAPPAGKVSVGLLVGIAVDVLLDGLLLGVGFAAGAKEGRLLALALALELSALGLATATSLTQSGMSKGRTLGIVSSLALLFGVGAVIGLLLLSHLSVHVLAGVIAFGAAALLFLVTEELLVEAHEEPETPALTATFFAGFLLFLLLGMMN